MKTKLDALNLAVAAIGNAREFVASAPKGGKTEEMKLRGVLIELCTITQQGVNVGFDCMAIMETQGNEILRANRRAGELRTQLDTLEIVNSQLSESCAAHAHDARKWRQVRTILASNGQIAQRLAEELRRAGVNPDE